MRCSSKCFLPLVDVAVLIKAHYRLTTRNNSRFHLFIPSRLLFTCNTLKPPNLIKTLIFTPKETDNRGSTSRLTGYRPSDAHPIRFTPIIHSINMTSGNLLITPRHLHVNSFKFPALCQHCRRLRLEPSSYTNATQKSRRSMRSGWFCLLHRYARYFSGL